MKVSNILGLNARSYFSYNYNKKRGKKVASSKLLTKRVLGGEDIPVPEIYAKFKDPRDIFKFNWQALPSSFALKPSRGYGGEGIIITKKKALDASGWVTTQRKRVTPDDLQLHVLDILEGAYSLGNVPDAAYVEEYVGRHKAFRKYAYRGTPDIRVIVFNRVPVMAMLRLPTKESEGRANFFQGAIGVGIDIATGITTRGFWHGKIIRYKPGTKKKLHGIKIPNWGKILEYAIKCQEATGLGYLGVDLVLHPVKGPMVLELNSQPGLKIQLANMAGLRRRLDRVEGLEIRDAEHGIRVAKALFAGHLYQKAAKEGPLSIQVFETIKVRASDSKKVNVPAKVDTGAWRTVIDERLAGELGLLNEDNILWTKKVRSSMGVQERPVINLTYWLSGRKITTPASVARRTGLRYSVIIGRKDLRGMLIDIQPPEKL